MHVPACDQSVAPAKSRTGHAVGWRSTAKRTVRKPGHHLARLAAAFQLGRDCGLRDNVIEAPTAGGKQGRPGSTYAGDEISDPKLRRNRMQGPKPSSTVARTCPWDRRGVTGSCLLRSCAPRLAGEGYLLWLQRGCGENFNGSDLHLAQGFFQLLSVSDYHPDPVFRLEMLDRCLLYL